MGCVSFWLNNPLKALENIKSIIPRPGQCIDEKLNGLSLFVILFTVLLGVAGVKNFWVFGTAGLFLIIIAKLFFFKGRRGKASVEDYMSGSIPMDEIDSYIEDSEVYEAEELEDEKYYTPIYEDDLGVRPALNNTGETWEDLKGNVGDQIAHARFPSMTHGCFNDNNCYY